MICTVLSERQIEFDIEKKYLSLWLRVVQLLPGFPFQLGRLTKDGVILGKITEGKRLADWECRATPQK